MSVLKKRYDNNHISKDLFTDFWPNALKKVSKTQNVESARRRSTTFSVFCIHFLCTKDWEKCNEEMAAAEIKSHF